MAAINDPAPMKTWESRQRVPWTCPTCAAEWDDVPETWECDDCGAVRCDECHAHPCAVCKRKADVWNWKKA